MKKDSDQWEVDDQLLTETGRGGLFTDGYLQGSPLISYLESSETPLFVFGSGKRGVTRESDGETTRHVPASGYRAIIAVTDRRVQFVVGGAGTHGDDDWAASVRLSNVDRVSVDAGLIRDRLIVSTGDVDWSVYLKDIDTDTVVEYVTEISWAWITVEERLDDARTFLVDATQQQKAREYLAAHDSLDRAREKLDDATRAAAGLAEEAAVGVRERITAVESRYRETKRRTHDSEARHLVGLAEEYWRDDEYELAYETYRSAVDTYREALETPGLDAEKAEDIRDRIDRIQRNLDHLRTAPLENASRTRRAALDAEAPDERIELWSAVLDQYREVIELDWGRPDPRFAGDAQRCRDRVAEAVDELLDARREEAERRRRRGDDLILAGEISEARDCYSGAASQLEAAVELAREFDPAETARLRERLDTLADRISDATASVVRTAASPVHDTDDPADDETTRDSEAEPDATDGEAPAPAGVDAAETASAASVENDEKEPAPASAVDDSVDTTGETPVDTGDRPPGDAYDNFDNWVTLQTDQDDADAEGDPDDDTDQSSDDETQFFFFDDEPDPDERRGSPAADGGGRGAVEPE